MGESGARRAELTVPTRINELIARLSHELRNPLGAIRTSLYILEHEQADSDATAEARTVIDRQVSDLVRMLDDLMDVTRIAEGTIVLYRRPFDLTDIARAAVEETRLHFETADVGLKTRLAPGAVRIRADGARIKQVLTNLLTNAAKFTPPGGTATLSVGPDGEGGAVVTVADTGCGIDPSLLPHLFEPFSDGDRTADRRARGLGIGLALVKHLVALHGGEVRVRSPGLDQGAEFIVRLPLDAEAPG
jgi:signal transduction histidine kinase